MIQTKSKKISKSLLIIYAFFILEGFISFNPQTVISANNLQNGKDTLSDSRPSDTTTKHTIYFKNTTALSASYKIIIDFPSQFDLTSSHTYADMAARYSANADLSSSTSCTLAAASGAGEVGVSVDTTNEKVTFTLASSGTCSSISASQYLEITIGDGASGGSDDITNPAKSAAAGTADTYVINYETQTDASATLDTATVRVAIIDAITISAEVQATLSCSVSGVASGANFNSSPGGNTYGTAGFATTTTTIPFGILSANSASQSGQLLKASTNGSNGFYFAVKQTGNLTSGSSDDIDVFDDSTAIDNSSPTVWSSPAATAGTEGTYGHLGYGATDLALEDLNGSGASDRFTGAKFAGLTTTYEAILSHDGPADGTGSDTNGQGYIIYKVEISGLQETGVYTNTISYLCTGKY